MQFSPGIFKGDSGAVRIGNGVEHGADNKHCDVGAWCGCALLFIPEA